MRDFDLVSVDWDTVRLMQAGQFKQETFYLEELTRWMLQRGRWGGLLHLEDDGVSAPSPESDRIFSVSVRGCIGVTPLGRIIEISADRQTALTGTIEARSTLVPLYIGVAINGRAKEPQLYPTIDTGLLNCGGLRPQYLLSADDSDDSVDWLQIAQFEKTTTGLRISPDYVPECLFISSHATLLRAQESISDLARRALITLTRESSRLAARFAVAAALAGSLGPAARAVDGRLSPRAYIDRLAGVLAGQHTQLLALPPPNLRDYQETVDRLQAFLSYLDDSRWTLGQALTLARECFERLLQLYGPLLQSLDTAGPAPERQILEHRTVVEAEQERQPQAADPGGSKKGFMWRK